ncbi:MAG: MMPL family transporter [Pseudomonadota bacterium]
MLWVVAWVNRVVQRPRLILAVVGLITIVAAWVAVTQFRMNSDLGDLIDQQSDWRADFDRFEAAFPDLVRTGVIVVRSPSIKQLELTTTAILDELAARPDYFTAIAAPGAERFFRDHAMLYMDLDDLDDMADRLAEAQPWLTAVAETNSLAGVLRLVADGVENDAPTGFDKVLDLLGTSLQRLTAGEDATIWWTDEMFASDEIRYQLIYVKAFSQFDVALPNAVFVAQLREVIAGLENHPDVDVWLTGELPLQHEEIEAAISGVSLAGWLSLALLFVVMLLGVRSGKIIAATFLMLLIGVIWTSALAMLTVGEYNTLSVVFIVMFFGLGVDFALHFSLRFQQAVNAHVPDVAVALQDSASSVGRAIVLCTLTTAIGFLGFVPTDYRGLADLGTISAGGMLVACFLALTFLPAFYMVSGAPKAHLMNLPTSDRVVAWLVRRRRPVVICVCIVGAFAAWQTSQAKFDYSTLALKDPNSQSMQALRLLQAEDLSTDYQLVVVREAAVPKARLEALEEVEEVRTLLDFVPDEQEDKLYVLEDLQEMLWSALQPQRAEGVNQADNRRATAALIDTLAAHIGGGEDPSGAIDEGRRTPHPRGVV